MICKFGDAYVKTLPILIIISIREEAVPHSKKEISFDPNPLSTSQQINIVNKWSDLMSDGSISQDGCAVCGRLTNISELFRLNLTDKMAKLLTNPTAVPIGWISPASSLYHWTADEYHTTWKQYDHQILLEANEEYQLNPVLDRSCYIWYEQYKTWSPQSCAVCLQQLTMGNIPSMALARNKFSGTIPPCLADLTFMERLIISQLRHNFFTIDLTSNKLKGGTHKYIRANAVVFCTPYHEITTDHLWPMKKENLDKIVVCTFLGSEKPTTSELIEIRNKCYFLTVRYKYLIQAIQFLQQFNRHYQNIQINNEVLETYKVQHTFPINYIQKDIGFNDTLEPSIAETVQLEENDGVSFVLRGVTADDIAQLSAAKRKIHAINHIKNGGQILGIGHSSELESMWNRPDNWEKLFPHLYPFGIGGPKNLRDVDYITSKLTHHSRAFQQDNVWLMLMYNQKEIQSVTNRSRIIIKRNDFQHFTDSLETITEDVIDTVNNKISLEGLPAPETPEQESLINLCKLIGNGRTWVKGSAAEKLQLKSQLFNMTRFEGAPIFFLTYSPGDINNPIACKFVGMDINVDDLVGSTIPDWKQRIFAIYRDPVSTERFFHYSVQCFIECFINGGLFGPDPLYCGPVEEQGRKSLHWHLLLWLRHTETLSEIKLKLSNNIQFQQQFIQWIESVVQCGYINEDISTVSERNKEYNRNGNYEHLFYTIIYLLNSINSITTNNWSKNRSTTCNTV